MKTSAYIDTQDVCLFFNLNIIVTKYKYIEMYSLMYFWFQVNINLGQLVGEVIMIYSKSITTGVMDTPVFIWGQ